jgi:hypothetical protein
MFVEINEKYFSLQEILDMIMQTNKHGRNLLFYAVESSTKEILELTWSEIRNIIQDEIFCDKLEHHKALWKIILKSTENKEKLKDLILIKDFRGNNFFLHLVMSSSSNIIEFAFNILKANFSDEQFREIIQSKGYLGRNFLQIATDNVNHIKTHQKRWILIKKYFNSSELLDIINHCDDNGDNILHDVVYWNKEKIVQFTWNQIKKFIKTKKGQVKYLKTKGHEGCNLLEISSANQSEDPKVHIWVKNLITEYGIDFDRKKD